MKKTKFILVTLTALAVSMVFASSATASGLGVSNKTLVNKLKEKGLLTKEEAHDILKKDKKHFLKIGGRLQVQYEGIPDNGTATKENTSKLFVRRARLSFRAQVTENAFFALQTEFGKQSVTLKDAYVGIKIPAIGTTLKIGNNYVPFSREALNSSKYLHFVERTETSGFAPFRQMGITAVGSLFAHKLKIAGGVYNGSVEDKFAKNDGVSQATPFTYKHLYKIDTAGFKNSSAGQPANFMYAARVDFSPFGKFKLTQGDFGGDQALQIGVNFYTQNYGSIFASNNSGLDGSTAYGADFGYRGFGFSIEGEYINRNLRFDDTAIAGLKGRDVRQVAASIQGGYMFLNALEAAVRFEQIDYDDNDILKGKHEKEDQQKSTTFGLNYYLKKHHLKLQGDYVVNQYEMPTGVKAPEEDRIELKVAYYF